MQRWLKNREVTGRPGQNTIKKKEPVDYKELLEQVGAALAEELPGMDKYTAEDFAKDRELRGFRFVLSRLPCWCQWDGGVNDDMEEEEIEDQEDGGGHRGEEDDESSSSSDEEGPERAPKRTAAQEGNGRKKARQGQA